MKNRELYLDDVQNENINTEEFRGVSLDLFMSIFLGIGMFALTDLVLKIQMPAWYLISAIFSFFVLFSLSLIFIKAGEVGWKAFIPIYNIITYLRIVGKPAWWTLLMFIPIVNFAVYVWMANLLAIRFGKDAGFTAGMIILPFIYYPVLAYGEQKGMKRDQSNINDLSIVNEKDEDKNNNKNIKYEQRLKNEFGLTRQGTNWAYFGKGALDEKTQQRLHNAKICLEYIEEIRKQEECDLICIVPGNPTILVLNTTPPFALAASMKPNEGAELIDTILKKTKLQVADYKDSFMLSLPN